MNFLNSFDTPELAAIAEEEGRAANTRFGDQQAAEAKAGLKGAIANTRAIVASPRLASVMNMRDKHLAHSLTATHREKRGPVPPMTYGDGKALLDNSIPIIESFFCWVNGKSFSISNSQKIDHENAQALWLGCKNRCASVN